MKVLTVIGARPQFIKAAPVSRALKKSGYEEFLVHTGQHYDYQMSQVFFDELDIPVPDLNLDVGSGSHGWQTGKMLIRLEEVIRVQRPDWVLVYGDTNSTLAGALASAKLNIPVAHVEAGLRSFDRKMPEEINRVATDHIAARLYCPTQLAVAQLVSEGIRDSTVLSGDVMFDAYLYDRGLAQQVPSVLERLGVAPQSYVLMTLHRPANTDDPDMLRSRLAQISVVETPVIWPIHPRTLAAIQRSNLAIPPNVKVVEPLGRLEMIQALESAAALITDSGGLQKESYWAKVPCFTLREETEWVETVQTGWNSLISNEARVLWDEIRVWERPFDWPALYGNGDSAGLIVSDLAEHHLDYDQPGDKQAPTSSC